MKAAPETIRKVKRRERLSKALGMQIGTIYERHVVKFQASTGYVRDGNLRHYVACNRKRKIHLKGRRDA